MFLLGYLTPEQWKDAIDGFVGLDKQSAIAVMRKVEKYYDTKFDLGYRVNATVKAYENTKAVAMFNDMVKNS